MTSGLRQRVSGEGFQVNYDVCVVGGGHAGCEAALACARVGCDTVLVTSDRTSVACMPCNPAIGGLAKGQLVREIDALGGEMGRIADRTGIQFRMLNTNRGPAVRSPRAQSDKRLYSAAMLAALDGAARLTLVEGRVESIDAPGGAVRGVRLTDGRRIDAGAAIITTGTFLNGLLHIGLESREGGRIDEPPACGLARSLAGLGLELGRLKTGTPARVERESIDYHLMEEQPGDDVPVPFSFETSSIPLPQVSCFVTRTNATTHEIIRSSLDRSPLFTGRIVGAGPRYCPSIEDKVHRFGDRDGHRIFVEPEGLDAGTVYLNGISTSLPLDVQERMVRSIVGLERARIVKPGYAVEYDFVPSYQLRPTLETLLIKRLYLAGQINGTSGYEEAAAQGLMAGLNAALELDGRDPFVLKRFEAYIGVLIDDLVIRSPREPYRMFTSLAEYRLILRQDNADRRLTPHGAALGLISPERHARLIAKEHAITCGRDSLRRLKKDGTTLERILRRPEVRIEDILEASVASEGLDELRRDRAVAEQVEIDVKYEGYIQRQEARIARLAAWEDYRLQSDLDYGCIDHLKPEAREKLALLKPATLGQASRIAGITPADLSVLMAFLGR